MKQYKSDADNLDEIVDDLTRALEKETGNKIFTLRVLESDPEAEEFEAIVVFEDKSILHTLFTMQPMNDKIGFRMRGKYI